MTSEGDRFLDGAVTIRQTRDGFRSGLDAVLLAASVTARPGQRLLELGCGAGAALICAAHRAPDCAFTGLEADPGAAALARENVAANGMDGRVTILEGDVADPELPGAFDHVFFNPPFYDDPAAMRAPKPGKTRAFLTPGAPLSVWVKTAGRALKPKGVVTLIHRADRLGDILAALGAGWGDVAVMPVHPRADAPAKRVLVSARRATKGPLVLLAPLILHEGEGAAYSEAAEAVLRGRAALTLRPGPRL